MQCYSQVLCCFSLKHKRLLLPSYYPLWETETSVLSYLQWVATLACLKLHSRLLHPQFVAAVHAQDHSLCVCCIWNPRDTLQNNDTICYRKQQLQWPPIDQATHVHSLCRQQEMKSITADSTAARSLQFLINFKSHIGLVVFANIRVRAGGSKMILINISEILFCKDIHLFASLI